MAADNLDDFIKKQKGGDSSGLGERLKERGLGAAGFFVFFSGVSTRIVGKYCPRHEQLFYRNIGVFVFIICIVSGLSFWHMAHSYFPQYPALSYGLAFIWVLFVYALDASSVNAIAKAKSEDSTKRVVGIAISRIVVILLSSTLVASATMTLLYEDTIAKIALQKSQNAIGGIQDKENKKLDGIRDAFDENLKRRAALDSLPQDLRLLNTEKKRLEAEKKGYETSKDAVNSERNAFVLANFGLPAYLGNEKVIDSLADGTQKNRLYAFKTKITGFAADISNTSKEIAKLKAEYDKEAKQHDIVRKDLTKGNDSLLINLQAQETQQIAYQDSINRAAQEVYGKTNFNESVGVFLSDILLSGGSDTAVSIFWILFIVGIEIAPITLKAIQGKGAYEEHIKNEKDSIDAKSQADKDLRTAFFDKEKTVFKNQLDTLVTEMAEKATRNQRFQIFLDTKFY